jgi:tetratricopeptide (TPR) repeat protein
METPHAIRLSSALGLSCLAAHLVAQTVPPAAGNDPVARARRQFIEAEWHFRVETTNAEAAWQFGRAAFDWAEFATNNSQRAAIAEQGIAACRQLTAREPRLAAAHYYLALNLGKLADATRNLGGLKLVMEMEREFKVVRQLDPGFDYAGADRSLGMLYRDAPGWPISVGSRSKARVHLRKAVELAPDYPDNRLCLLETYLEWGDKKAARAELARVEETLRIARRNFSGDQWAASWRDWDKRLEQIKARISEPTSPLKSPHGD